MDLADRKKYLENQKIPLLIRADFLVKDDLTRGTRIILEESFIKVVTPEQRAILIEKFPRFKSYVVTGKEQGKN